MESTVAVETMVWIMVSFQLECRAWSWAFMAEKSGCVVEGGVSTWYVDHHIASWSGVSGLGIWSGWLVGGFWSEPLTWGARLQGP